MKITWYGHSAFRIDVADRAILIDPFLSGNPSWDGGWEDPASGITHVLLTHGHDDHIGDTADILKNTGAMGDTDIFGDMALVEELHRPQVGMVPIGDRFTMGGAVAALACRRYFRFETIFPCHYATFPMLDQSTDTFIEAMEGDRGKVKAVAIGESVSL